MGGSANGRVAESRSRATSGSDTQSASVMAAMMDD
jgi:hypothetical protein